MQTQFVYSYGIRMVYERLTLGISQSIKSLSRTHNRSVALNLLCHII